MREDTGTGPAGLYAVTGGLVLLALLLFSPALSPDRIFVFKDAGHLVLAHKQRISESIRDGRLPLWDERVACGQPFLADPVAQVFYPGNLLFVAFSPGRGIKLFALLHLGLAAAALAWLGRETGLPEAASGAAALVFLGSGALVSHHWNVPWLGSLPWMLAAMVWGRRLISGRGRWMTAAAVAGCVALIVLAGGFELLPALAVFWVVQGAWWTIRPREPGRPVRGTVYTALAALLGLALAACQLLPTYELYTMGVRSIGLPAAEALTWSFYPLRLLELVAPHLFGNAAQGESWMGLISPSLFGGQPYFAGVYLGVPALALALAGLRVLPGREAVLWVGVLLSAVVLSLGHHTPLFDLFRLVPPLGFFRYPAKIFTLAMIPMALLAGAALGAVAEGNRRVRRTLAGLGALFALLLLGALLAGYLQRPGWIAWIEALQSESGAPVVASQAWQATLSGLLRGAAAALLLALTAGLVRSPRAGFFCLLALVAFDMGLANRSLLATRNAAEHLSGYASLPPPQSVGEGRVALTGPGSVNLLAPPHHLALLGYRVADGYGSMRLGNTVMLNAALRDRHRRQLALKSTRFAPLPGSRPGALEFGPVSASLPRARVVPHPALAPDHASAASYLASERFDPRREVILRSASMQILEWARPQLPGRQPRARIVRDRPEEVIVEVDSSQPAFLVLSDSYYPGWRAAVNDRSAEIYPANLMFRAVPVPQGTSRVRFWYQPVSLRVGLQISGLALLLLIWLGTEAFRESRKKPQS